MSMMSGDPQIEALTRSECLDYLATATVGRLGLTMRALPAIVPVRFALAKENVFFRTPSDSRLRELADGSVVVLQADHDGNDTGIGWTVQVQGLCQEIMDPSEMTRLLDLPLSPWKRSPPGDSFMRIPLNHVRGERVIW